MLKLASRLTSLAHKTCSPSMYPIVKGYCGMIRNIGLWIMCMKGNSSRMFFAYLDHN